ncbi:MAG TPA: phosphoglycerate dehydrogenase [Solirubrobacterales bacterium]|nr:phosphoglycerate dehydrogenase [Solirubrobacterales bacterium]
MPVALITCLHLQRDFERFRPELESLGVEPVLPEVEGQQLDAPAMGEVIEGAAAVIAGDDVIDAKVLEAGKASGLEAVIKWGVGTDSIDAEAASRLGIPVFNTPGVFADEVADLAMSHLLMLARGTHRMHESILEGEWEAVQGRSLSGLVAGVVGLGTIGCAIGRRAAAFGMSVCGYDVREVPPEEHGVEGLEQVGFEELCARSDVVLVACKLTPENHHLISEEALGRMKQGVVLINVARGALVDQAALHRALESGKVAGAGLDVFEEEPLPPTDPLRDFSDRCVFTTHSGSNTKEAVARINRMTIDILLDVLELKPAQGFQPNRVA